MKKIMFTLLLAAISTGAMAEWIRVSDGMLYDSTSIQKVGDIVTIAIAMETSQTGNERYHYSEHQYDCKIAGKYRIYAGGIPFKGSVSSEWFIVPDDRLWPIACSKASNSSAPTYGKQPTPPASAPTRESSGPVTATIEKGEQGSSGGGGAFWIIGVVVALALLLWKVLGSTVQDDTPSKLLATRRLLIAALALDAMVGLLLSINAFYTKGVVKDLQSGTRVFSDSILASWVTWDRVASFSIFTTIAVGICLVRWISACYRYSEDVIGAEGFEQKGWKIWGWVIPFIFFYKPYKVLSEIYRSGSSYEGKTGWMQTNASGGLLAWWIAYCIIHVLMVQTGRWMTVQTDRLTPHMIQTQTPDVFIADLISFYDLRGWFFVMSLIICAMWLKLINTFTDRLTTRVVVDDEIEVPPKYQSKQTVPTAVNSVANRETVPGTAATHKYGPSEYPDFRPTSAGSDTLQARVYAAIANELESGETDKGLWIRLFAESNGDEKMTKVAYIKQRAAMLMAAERTGSHTPERKNSVVPEKPPTNGDDEWQLAKQSADLADQLHLSIAEARAMVTLGIEKKGDRFILKDGRGYNTLVEAISSARRGNG